MFQKNIYFHKINDNKSFSNLKEKSSQNISNLKQKYNSILISPKKTKLIESKSQTDLLKFKKHIKLSFNKFHQYIKNLEAEKKIENNKRPLSLHFYNKNKKNNFINNNNREEIQNDFSYVAKHKTFYDKFRGDSKSQTNRTMFLNYNKHNINSGQKKLNKLNIGINSQSSFMINYKSNNNNDTSIFTKIQSSYTTIYNKNITNLTLKKLKNSKFFYKTKYVNGLKNKNLRIIKSHSLSTYNISFNPEEKNDALYKTINAIIRSKLLNKMKITESEESNANKLKQIKKISNQDDIENIERAQYFDLLPIILNHIKKKRIMDDIYGEYNLYLSNISKTTLNSNSPNKKNNLEINKFPKIKYLFLENIISNLKHIVKFVNIKNNEELEQNVINIIRDQYNKIKQENKEIENLQDFLTYGYEYVPRRELYTKLPFLEEKGFQTSKLFYDKNSNKHSIFFVNEQKEENQNSLRDNNNSNEKIYSMKNVYLNYGFTSKKRNFEKMEFKSRNSKNELKEDLASILSSYSVNNEIKKIEKKDIKDLLQNEQLKKLDIFKNKEKEKEKEKEKGKKFKPKFIKIKLKGLNKNEGIEENNSNKISDKINETSSFEGKETIKEIIESYKETSNEKILENKNLEQNKEQKEENINDINNNINDINTLPEEKKENINSNIIIPDNKEISKENNNSNSDIKQHESQIINEPDKNIKEDDSKKEEKNKDNKIDINKEEEKKQKQETIKKDISKKKGKTLTTAKKRKEKIKKEVEIKDINDDDDLSQESSKNTRKNKKGYLKKRKTNNFLQSIENTLIALNQIQEHSKKNAKKNAKKHQSVYFELMYNHRHPDQKTNPEYDEDSHQTGSNNQEKNGQTREDMNSLENKDLEGKEITVSSLSVSSESELKEEFKVLKKTILSKTKKQAFDEEKRKNIYRRRDALINPSIEVFKEAVKSQKMADLNNKMKKIYEDIHKEKKREEYKSKKRKFYIFSFAGVDPTNFEEIEKRKFVNLNRLKEDIKFKISEGKYHAIELDNFQNFSKAIMAINLAKYRNNPKKLIEYMHSLEKYFQLFYNELINREKQNNDEKRINKFLYNLKQEVGETIPFVTNYKGKFCRSIDLNKEGDLSILNSP